MKTMLKVAAVAMCAMAFAPSFTYSAEVSDSEATKAVKGRSATLGSFDLLNEATITDEHFQNGNSSKATMPKQEGTGPFFKDVIE